MFEKFTSKDAADFRQRYQGTYGFFRRGENKTLARLDNIVVGNTNTVEFSDKSGLKCYLRADSEDETIGFDFLPPRLQYHDTENASYLLRRIPARQYLRGICDRNTAITTVGGIPYPIGFDVLTALFEGMVDHKTRYLKVCTTPEGTAERSFCISGQFAIGLDSKKIFCLGRPIGKAMLGKDNMVLVTLHDYEMWGTEVKDALRRANITGEVK